MPNADESAHPAAEIKKPGSPGVRSIWGIRYIKRKLHERKTKKEHESPADRAARRTAIATIWMAVFTVVLAFVSGGTLLILNKQLGEMHGGGIDTHDLAVQAKNQADRLKDLAGRMKDQSDRTKDLADQMKKQVEKLDAQVIATRRLADSAGIQSKQAVEQTNKMAASLVKTDALIEQTKDANKLAIRGRRPWVGIERDLEIIEYSFGQRDNGFGLRAKGTIQLKNFGESPALRANIEIEAIPATIGNTAVKTFSSDLENAKNGECATAQVHTVPPFSGIYLFPGKITGETEVGVGWDSRLTPESQPIFVGCIVYWDQDGTRHRTTFTYSVKGGPVQPAMPYIRVIPIVPTRYEGKLELVPWPFNQTAD